MSPGHQPEPLRCQTCTASTPARPLQSVCEKNQSSLPAVSLTSGASSPLLRDPALTGFFAAAGFFAAFLVEDASAVDLLAVFFVADDFLAASVSAPFLEAAAFFRVGCFAAAAGCSETDFSSAAGVDSGALSLAAKDACLAEDF